MLKVCDALHYAHQQTVHRDVKPENVFLTEDGEVKLMDFGIARAASSSDLTRTGSTMGTAYYMAPEQLRDAKEVDHRADQYSVAVMLYELIAGFVPAGRPEPSCGCTRRSASGAPRRSTRPSPPDRPSASPTSPLSRAS